MHYLRFNPRARAGRDQAFGSLRLGLCPVSIHAPARGATLPARPRIRPRGFQSTRPRGARHHTRCRYAILIRFNPRARAGRDHEQSRINLYIRVSIHAPARGATKRDHGNAYHEWFQSTRPRGARHAEAEAIILEDMFQSTRPRGARPIRRRCTSTAVRFNPRARAGRDIFLFLWYHLMYVSIHAPARSARLMPDVQQPSRKSFNPRARAGRDQKNHGIIAYYQSFNPRARAGRDPPSRTLRTIIFGFNPRARAGRDRDYAVMRLFWEFQSTRPRGARPE